MYYSTNLLFKGHNFRTYFQCIIRYNNVSRLVHDPCDPHEPLPKIWRGRDPQPPGLTPLVLETYHLRVPNNVEFVPNAIATVRIDLLSLRNTVLVGYIDKNFSCVSCASVKEIKLTEVRFPNVAYFRDLNLGLARSLHWDLKGRATGPFRRTSGGEGSHPHRVEAKWSPYKISVHRPIPQTLCLRHDVRGTSWSTLELTSYILIFNSAAG